MAFQYKVTIKGPPALSASDPSNFRTWFKAVTGNSGSPAIKNLYQAGKVVAYPEIVVTVTGEDNLDVRPECTALYEFNNALSREQFSHNSHEWGEDAIAWRNKLIASDFQITGELIDS